VVTHYEDVYISNILFILDCHFIGKISLIVRNRRSAHFYYHTKTTTMPQKRLPFVRASEWRASSISDDLSELSSHQFYNLEDPQASERQSPLLAQPLRPLLLSHEHYGSSFISQTRRQRRDTTMNEPEKMNGAVSIAIKPIFSICKSI
jgi:hypothetical protein